MVGRVSGGREAAKEVDSIGAGEQDWQVLRCTAVTQKDGKDKGPVASAVQALQPATRKGERDKAVLAARTAHKLGGSLWVVIDNASLDDILEAGQVGGKDGGNRSAWTAGQPVRQS